MNPRADEALVDLLGQLDPMASLPLERREELSQLCVQETVAHGNGEFMFAEKPGQTVYLLRGEIRLAFADGSFEVLVGGSDTARHPLGSGKPVLLSCKPITDIELLRLDEEILDLVLAWDQSREAKVTSAAQAEGTDWRKMSGIFAAHHLARSAFASLPAANIDRMLDRFERIKVKRGDVILREGAAGDYYYLIESGRCIVTRYVGGVDMEIADLKPGDPFGEEALLTKAERNATVTMKTDGVLLRLSKSDFIELLSEPLLNRVGWTEANYRVAAGAQWIDVRFAAEFVHDGLPGAINIPLNEIRRSVALLDAKREYVAYCQSGRRSSAAAFLLSQRGLQASVLAGGLRGRPSILPETISQ